MYNFKTPDALHIATAQYHNCTNLWTNDDRLNKSVSKLATNILLECQKSKTSI